MRVKLHREGTNILIIGLILVLAINLPLWLWVRPMIWAIASSTVFGVTYLLAVNFFRSPKRMYKGERRDIVVSSADGKVVALEETYEGEYLKGPALQLSVFMSPLNVHANWFPVDGEVIYTAHHSGRFMGAYLPKSSVENERSTVVIRTPGGQLVLVRQVAGAMARRIVTYAYPGVEASIEDHMGFIKFGSRVDIYLPVGTETFVNVGDKTIGGITRVARLK
ncbi:MAG: phosphatidylserine decarboxylase family protein [Muribaculaceae bacterium]|nr:phosphatidylserine decarboxylase family protein [Muribaculaceae bacterium]MDE6332432.1 phosphatidylserine decarboxylase family protein [Muribaculaceae bacterium]